MEVIHDDQHFLGIDLVFIEVGDGEDVFFVLFQVVVDVAFVVIHNLPALNDVDATLEMATLQQQTG